MNDKWCAQRADGVSLSIKVKANAKKTALAVANDLLRVEVQAPALDGRANTAVIALLAERFCCPRSEVVFLRGEQSPIKVVLLRGLTLSRVLECIAR